MTKKSMPIERLKLSEGLRRDEALLEPPVAQLIRALIAQGVSAELIEKASQGIVAKR